jgi:aromatic-L-amino-acid decarboxylase
MDADEFRRLGHALIDWVADYRETLASRPVMSRVLPGEIRARLPSAPPEQGGGAAAILDHLERSVLPGITHWNHPAFFAYFPSNTSYASVLADLACAGIGAQGMSWQTSPAATEIEEVMMDWLRQLVALPPSFTGVIQDTASTATLGALICARERSGGLGGTPLVVYASAQAHSSVTKAAVLAGFARSSLRMIGTDARYAMKPALLRQEIERDLDDGLRPCAVVATAGTTATTAFDPIEPIAAIAADHGMWLHVDAAMAGTGMILPELRELWHGVERADSVVLNPHKWMGAGFDLSAYYCRDVQHLIRVMSTDPSYLRTQHDGAVSNFRDWHIQLGRRFRALKLWFLLLDVGAEGVRARLRRDLANARWLAEQVSADPEWELFAPVQLQTVCLRHRHVDSLVIARRVNDGGSVYVTPSVVEDKQIIRVSIGAERTERAEVELVWGALREAAGAS